VHERHDDRGEPFGDAERLAVPVIPVSHTDADPDRRAEAPGEGGTT
jgi:hypothetical protein